MSAELLARTETEIVTIKPGCWPFEMQNMFDCVTSHEGKYIYQTGNWREIVEINGRDVVDKPNSFCQKMVHDSVEKQQPITLVLLAPNEGLPNL